MGAPDRSAVTELLARIRNGDLSAKERLFRVIYDEMRRIAHRVKQEKDRRHSLQASDLVQGAMLRMVTTDLLQVVENRRHLYAIAATAMRRILIDRARERKAQKRGGGSAREPLLDDMVDAFDRNQIDLPALDEALEELKQRQERQYDAIDCLYFVGMTQPEIANALGVSLRTIEGDLKKAKDFLRRYLQE